MATGCCHHYSGPDGFGQDQGASEGDEGPVASRVFSHRMATRLKRLSLPIACSTRARVLYSSLGKNLGLFLAFSIRNNRNDAAARQAARLAVES